MTVVALRNTARPTAHIVSRNPPAAAGRLPKAMSGPGVAALGVLNHPAIFANRGQGRREATPILAAGWAGIPPPTLAGWVRHDGPRPGVVARVPALGPCVNAGVPDVDAFRHHVEGCDLEWAAHAALVFKAAINAA